MEDFIHSKARISSATVFATADELFRHHLQRLIGQCGMNRVAFTPTIQLKLTFSLITRLVSCVCFVCFLACWLAFDLCKTCAHLLPSLIATTVAVINFTRCK